MDLLMTLAQTSSAVDSADDSTILFCNFIFTGIPYILEYLSVIGCWVVGLVLFYCMNETIGRILTVVIFLAYILMMCDEFAMGHTSHGVIALIPIILLVIAIIVFVIKFAIEEKIRKGEIPQIPGRAEKFISTHGYASPQEFIKYSDEDPEFQHARKVQYTNPLYTKQVSENEKRKKNNQEPLKITEPSEIGYGKFAGFKYKEVVLTHFMTELPDVLKNIYMFDHADIFVHMPDYSRFFMNLSDSDTCPSEAKTTYRDYFEDISIPGAPEQTEDDNTKYELLLYDYKTVDEIYFKQSCVGVINKLIADNIIERVGNNDIFRSKVIPEEEGNIVEGETLEISFDD